MKRIIGGAVSTATLLVLSISAAMADDQNSGTCVTDIRLYPRQNDQIIYAYDDEDDIKAGYWDVDNQGVSAKDAGTGSTIRTGNYITTLSAKREPMSKGNCLEDIKLYTYKTARSERYPETPIGYEYIGHWDIATPGGGIARGNSMAINDTMTLFVKRMTSESTQVVTDIWLHQAQGVAPQDTNIKPTGFETLAWWDVDSGGGKGTGGGAVLVAAL